MAPISPAPQEQAPEVRGPASHDRILDPIAVGAVVQLVRDALAAEAGHLSVAPALDWRPVPAEAFVDAAVVHRVVPIVASRLAYAQAPSRVDAAIRGLARAGALQALRLVAESAGCAAVLADAGIPFLHYKGVPLSLQSTGAATSRGAGDIDILVSPEDLPRAHAALLEAGWVGPPLEPEAWWWPWYLRMRRERSYVREQSSIDLHWRVAWHGEPMQATTSLIARRVTVEVAGVDVPTLAVPDALSTACYSATMDRFARLRNMVDIVRMARLPDARVPSDASWRLRRVIGEAVTFSDELVGGIPPERKAHLAPPGRVNVDRLWRVWESSSVAPLWMGRDLGLGGMLEVYREPMRYAGPGPALLMAASDGLLPPERLSEVAGPWDVPRLVGSELVDLLRVRVLGRDRPK